MKRGLILINAYSHLESELNQSERLRAELCDLGVEVDIRRNDCFFADIEDSTIAVSMSYDFVIYLDKDKYISDMLERSGMRLFNSHSAIVDCDDKMTTYIRLAGGELPLVDTMAGLLCYRPDESVSSATVDRVESAFGYPVIVKECYGSLGKGVYKCDTREALASTMERLKCVPHLFERYIPTSHGMDIRVIVVGDRCVSAMLRHSDGDFRSNLALGGHGTAVPINSEIERIALGATRRLGLDYAGIDLLIADERTNEYYLALERGENVEIDAPHYIICEVNSNAFFKGTEAVTGVNVAREYAEYIYDEMYVQGDPHELIANANRVSMTTLSIDRCARVLGNISRDEMLDMCKAMLLDADSHIYRAGKNWYVDDGNISFTINASTYMIITAKLLK